MMLEVIDKTPSSERWEQRGLRIVDLPSRKVAVVHTVGDPDRVMCLVLPALYSSVYKLDHLLREEGRDFRIEPLRVRWPGIQGLPRSRWHGIWGLLVPPDTSEMPQLFPHIAVEIELWEYGDVAELRADEASASGEEESIRRLGEFIAAQGFAVAGPLEEEYLSGPAPDMHQIIVRYPIRRREPVAQPDCRENTTPADSTRPGGDHRRDRLW